MAVHRNDIIEEWKDCETSLSKFNSKTGEFVTNLLGSMGFFWFCVTLDVLALPGLFIVIASTLGAKLPAWSVLLSVMVVVVSFVSQTVIQLLALPALQHAGNIAQRHADALAEATYRTAVESEKRQKEILGLLRWKSGKSKKSPYDVGSW